MTAGRIRQRRFPKQLLVGCQVFAFASERPDEIGSKFGATGRLPIRILIQSVGEGVPHQRSFATAIGATPLIWVLGHYSSSSLATYKFRGFSRCQRCPTLMRSPSSVMSSRLSWASTMRV